MFGLSPDFHRTEDDWQESAIDGRHNDRYQQLPESPLRDDRVAHCPYCDAVPVKTKNQIRAMLALPDETVVQLRAPVFKVYGEDYNFLFAEIRKKGYRRLPIGKEIDISEEVEIDETCDHEMEVIIDKFILKRIEKQVLVGIQNALMVGDQFLKVHILKPSAGGVSLSASTSCSAVRSHHGGWRSDARLLHVQ
jgi:excinuclease ABC subunit A